jgi:hypothetical protein
MPSDTSPERKKMNTILGLLLLAGLVYWLYPFVMGSRNMQAFCSGLSVGTPQQIVETSIADEGFRLTTIKDRPAFVHDPRAFGRFVCEVRFADGRLTSARYFLND